LVTAGTKFAGSRAPGSFVGAGEGTGGGVDDGDGAGEGVVDEVATVGEVLTVAGCWEVVVEQALVKRIVVMPSAAAVRMIVPFCWVIGTASADAGKRKVRERSYLRLTLAGLL
jgi:hypothetical protein